MLAWDRRRTSVVFRHSHYIYLCTALLTTRMSMDQCRLCISERSLGDADHEDSFLLHCQNFQRRYCKQKCWGKAVRVPCLLDPALVITDILKMFRLWWNWVRLLFYELACGMPIFSDVQRGLLFHCRIEGNPSVRELCQVSRSMRWLFFVIKRGFIVVQGESQETPIIICKIEGGSNPAWTYWELFSAS